MGSKLNIKQTVLSFSISDVKHVTNTNEFESIKLMKIHHFIVIINSKWRTSKQTGILIKKQFV